MLYDSCIRAFIKGNLGDDLFIHTLCKRYPDTQFVMCGEKAYKTMFTEHKNLKYVCTDTFFNKWLFRVFNIPAYTDAIIKKLIKKDRTVPNYRCLEYLSRHSRNNVLISGSIFMESGNNEFVMAPYYKNEKKYFESRPVVLGCNFGPYHSKGYYDFYNKCFDMARQVSFRDKYSHSLFVKENTVYAPDILFAYDKDCYMIPKEKDYVLISVMNLLKDFSDSRELQEQYEDTLAAFVNRLTKENNRVVLMGFCNAQGDNAVIASLYKKLVDKDKVKCVNYPDITYKEAVGYIAGARTVVATRYHAMILGWLYNKPVLPIVYNEKMTHVIEDLCEGCPYVTVEQIKEQTAGLYEEYMKVLEGEHGPMVERAVELSQKHFSKLDELYMADRR